jgi:hypothetical protein
MTIISSGPLEGSTGSCRYCDAKPVDMFSWDYARSGRDAELAALRAHLREPVQLKSGRLYRCPDCGQAWYLDAAENMTTRVPREREAILHEWSTHALSLGDTFVEVLASIGSIEQDRYSNGRGYRRIPCAIRWTDGGVSDPCIILVTDLPPILQTQPHVRLFGAVADVQVTDFALPLAVRCATRHADELRMGFAPTAVKDPSGRLLLVNWSADVFDFEGIRGRDIRLAKRPWSTDELPPIVAEPRDRIVYVYVDRGPYEGLLVATCP